jgi:hypothetical protein
MSPPFGPRLTIGRVMVAIAAVAVLLTLFLRLTGSPAGAAAGVLICVAFAYPYRVALAGLSLPRLEEERRLRWALDLFPADGPRIDWDEGGADAVHARKATGGAT